MAFSPTRAAISSISCAHRVFSHAQVRAAGAGAEIVGGAGGGRSSETGLDDLGPGRVARDVVRDDAAHPDQEIGFQAPSG